MESVRFRERFQQLVAASKLRIGHRTITHPLNREGFLVNHKRVLRLMREGNLLCLRERAKVLIIDSGHTWPIYPNLVASIRVTR